MAYDPSYQLPTSRPQYLWMHRLRLLLVALALLAPLAAAAQFNAFATQHAALDERANHLLDEERVAAGPRVDPRAQRRERLVGPEPIVE